MDRTTRVKLPKRALRRHHAARRKQWVRRALRHYFLEPDEPEARRVGLYAGTPRPCSCWMCGNPRRYFGEASIQEKRAAEAHSGELE